MKDLILVRHGESEHLVKGIKGGWTDLPLTDRGREQIKLTRKRLKELFKSRIEVVYTSDLKRAKETAEIILEELEIPFIIDSRFRDINKGISKDMSLEEAKKIAIPPSEPLKDWIPYPEGESWRMLQNRVSVVMNGIMQKSEDVVLIVGHERTNAAIIEWWLQLTEECSLDFFTHPASITWLGISSWNEREIKKLNETAHLAAAGLDDSFSK